MKDALLPPNLLTYARVALTPVVAWGLLRGRCELALWLMIAGGISDAADGYLARRFGWQSRLGAYLDPISDKLLMTTLFLCFSVSGLAPNWLAWVVIGRDLLILAMVAIAFAFTRYRDFPPSFWGKASTLLQIVLAVVLTVGCAYPSFEQPWTAAMIWTTAVFTVLSGADYVVYAIRTLRKQ